MSNFKESGQLLMRKLGETTRRPMSESRHRKIKQILPWTACKLHFQALYQQKTHNNNEINSIERHDFLAILCTIK